jgi:hypothetical protein
MLRAVDTADESLDASLDELRDVVEAAYDNVKLARRYLSCLTSTSDLSGRLQLAEAELVRAKVALNEIDQATQARIPIDQPAIIKGAPFGINRGGDHEHRN